jgi:hypothetical protein
MMSTYCAILSRFSVSPAVLYSRNLPLATARCLSRASTVYGHTPTCTVRSFIQYNISLILQFFPPAHCSRTVTYSVSPCHCWLCLGLETRLRLACLASVMARLYRIYAWDVATCGYTVLLQPRGCFCWSDLGLLVEFHVVDVDAVDFLWAMNKSAWPSMFWWVRLASVFDCVNVLKPQGEDWSAVVRVLAILHWYRSKVCSIRTKKRGMPRREHEFCYPFKFGYQ